MDEEFNNFETEGMDGSFDPSPDNTPTSDETEAKEIYDYQDLAKYAKAGKAVARGIIGIATLGVMGGTILGVVDSASASAGESLPVIESVVVEASAQEDAISYAFSVREVGESSLFFVVSSPLKEERFSIPTDGNYEGEVKELGYQSSVTWQFVLQKETERVLKRDSLILPSK